MTDPGVEPFVDGLVESEQDAPWDCAVSSNRHAEHCNVPGQKKGYVRGARLRAKPSSSVPVS